MVISFFPYPDYINAKMIINIYILCPDTHQTIWQPTTLKQFLQTDPPRNHLNEKSGEILLFYGNNCYLCSSGVEQR